jgi:hypothetical protein
MCKAADVAETNSKEHKAADVADTKSKVHKAADAKSEQVL